jgi:phosphocarrier protein HPr
MPDDTIEKSCTVRNKMGLHARPAALIVQTANKFPCEVTLVKDGQNVNGKSIMGVLMLAAAKGTVILVRTDGDDAQACADAIGELFEKGFNEQI